MATPCQGVGRSRCGAQHMQRVAYLRWWVGTHILEPCVHIYLVFKRYHRLYVSSWCIRSSLCCGHPPYMVWPAPWENSSWGRPFNQGSISGRPHPRTRDRESTKTCSNSQAMDSALWSCDHTPPFHPGRADRRLGPSHYECTGDVAHMSRCCSPPICKISSGVPSGDGAPRGASTCRWFWEVHQPRILHHPPNKQVLGWCLDWHDNRTSADEDDEGSRRPDKRTWHHRHCTGILHLRSSSMHPNHASQSCIPIIPIIPIMENLSGTSSASSEQHVACKDHKELRPARQNRDTTDLVRFICWLKTHNPFDPKYQTKLISSVACHPMKPLTVIEQMKLGVNFKRQW